MTSSSTSAVIHKLSSTLTSANTCFTFNTFSPTVASLSESNVAVSHALTYTISIENTRLLPSEDIYLEYKTQFRDIMFNRAKN